jgi:predicted acetylornithine/succinylornithine family transaminase
MYSSGSSSRSSDSAAAGYAGLDTATVKALYQANVLDTGPRRIALSHGVGSQVWDAEGNGYLDFATGIAVNALGHGHPALVQVLNEQGSRLLHTCNLYYNEWQGRLAQAINGLVGPGKMFFTNSGVESIEAVLKVARRWGSSRGRFEIITAKNSFHGRSLAGIAATGQEKYRKGFGPVVPGFSHVPFNDLAAAEAAITDRTVGIMIEGIQGEGGVTPATAEYLIGLRELTRKAGILLLIDAVQCGGFRTGCFQSYQRILEGHPQGAGFLPDSIAMAKSIGAGFPLGAAWISEQCAAKMDHGSHGTTYGGSPLACAVGLKVLEVVRAEKLDANIRLQGDRLRAGLSELSRHGKVRAVRGLGGLIGAEVTVPAAEAMHQLAAKGLLVVTAGPNVLRFLPPLTVSSAEVNRALAVAGEILG